MYKLDGRTIFEIGDVVNIPHYIGGMLQRTSELAIDKLTKEEYYIPATVPYQFKMPQQLQNRNKYFPNGELRV